MNKEENTYKLLEQDCLQKIVQAKSTGEPVWVTRKKIRDTTYYRLSNHDLKKSFEALSKISFCILNINKDRELSGSITLKTNKNK